MTAAITHTDPITTEIVRNGLLAASEEMKTNLMRTAYNRIIYEGLDFTVGLFTTAGETITIGLGLPMFVRGLSDCVKAMVAHYGAAGMNPGDILLTNDVNFTGSHLNHVTLVKPIFDADVLVGFAAAMGHWLDIGGVLDGVTKDIYSEGLQIPILKAYRAGVANQDLLDILQLNVRHPDRAMGDWRAEVIAVNTGERRFLELVRRHGRETVLRAIEQIFRQSEAVAREAARTIPDGVYEAESFMDNDAVNLDARVAMPVKVIVSGDEMTIDLSNISLVVQGFYNSGVAAGVGCAQLAFKCLTSPLDYPINDGSFRPLKVVLPPGRVVSARRPAPMRWWMTYPMTIVDTVFKALAPAIPDRVIAGHHADLNVSLMNWLENGVRHVSHVSTSGGWGAKHNEDGLSNTVCINDGDTHRAPVEQIENKDPLLIEKWELIPDSGGAGCQRGGLGTVQFVRVRRDLNLNVQIDRHHCAPWGLEGGEPGSTNTVTVSRKGEAEAASEHAKLLGVALRAGDAFIVRSGGGGGFGPAEQRAIEKVLDDVRQGYVGIRVAHDLYGIVLDPHGQVDFERTKARRLEIARMRSLRENAAAE